MNLNLNLFTTFQLNSVIGLETSSVLGSELWRCVKYRSRDRICRKMYTYSVILAFLEVQVSGKRARRVFICQWVPANLMLGVTLRWTSLPFRGSRNIPGRFMLRKPG